MSLTFKLQKEFWNSKLYRLQNIDVKNVPATKKIKFHFKIITIVHGGNESSMLSFLPSLLHCKLKDNNKAATIKRG